MSGAGTERHKRKKIPLLCKKQFLTGTNRADACNYHACNYEQGILRDGITTWMPSYISETFHLASSVSILTGIALPLFGIMCSQIASLINRKLIHNELRCGMAIFAPGFVAAFLLWLMPNGNAVLSVFLSALITGCMHGVNMILVSMIPPFFKKFNRVGFISGLVKLLHLCGQRNFQLWDCVDCG